MQEELTEEEIERMVHEVEVMVMPFYDEIEKIRRENPKREVGGRIINGKLELLDESKWKESSVIGESYEKERKLAEEGVLSFHTHPDSGLTKESAQDILSTYFRLKELIFHKDGVTFLIALKKLPIEKINEIDEQAWKEAQVAEEKWGDPAYWFWKGKLQERLPVRVIDIIDKNKPEWFAPSKKAAQKILDEISSWKKFAVSGVLAFDKEKGGQVLRPFTDLDGNCALGILKLAGVNIGKLTYVKPGESLKDAINLDTGDKFGVVYDEDTHTAYFDHHKKGKKSVTSTTEIMYKTMVEFEKIKPSKELDRLVDFVTKIDNRQYSPEKFLRSAKTILGLQQWLKFEQILAYFKDHESPTEELTPEEFEKYDLKEAALKQQAIIDEAMKTLDRMERERVK